MNSRLTLRRPSCDYRESHLEAMNELPDDRVAGYYLSHFSLTREEVEKDFPAFIDKLRRLGRKGEDGFVPNITYWGIVDGNYVGRVSLRLILNKGLLERGGHVGYEVRPSQRGKGYATEMLRLIIDESRRFGLKRLLLTCDETNAASCRIIEKCGGEKVKSFPGEGDSPIKLRYWIPTMKPEGTLKEAVESTLSYLDSKEARLHLERDPYWPKWDSPWWHMLALSEICLDHRIPSSLLELTAELMNSHYLHHFPLVESELPPGTDPFRNILCHCAMGSMVSVLLQNDIDVLDALPWISPWIERYQMDDGGFNCDEEAYTRLRPVSSLVSTLPMLELLTLLHSRALLDVEEPLARGYQYLIAHRFVRSQRSGEILDNSWLAPIFPRFYQYDILRALAFAAEYTAAAESAIDNAGFAEALDTVGRWFNSDRESSPRIHTRDGSLLPDGAGGWSRGPSTSFPLLQELSKPDTAMKYLAVQWNRVKWFLEAESTSPCTP